MHPAGAVAQDARQPRSLSEHKSGTAHVCSAVVGLLEATEVMCHGTALQ